MTSPCCCSTYVPSDLQASAAAVSGYIVVLVREIKVAKGFY